MRLGDGVRTGEGWWKSRWVWCGFEVEAFAIFAWRGFPLASTGWYFSWRDLPLGRVVGSFKVVSVVGW